MVITSLLQTYVIHNQLLTILYPFILHADVPVWSKLETGRIPQPPELFQIIDSHMQFGKMDVDQDVFST